MLICIWFILLRGKKKDIFNVWYFFILINFRILFYKLKENLKYFYFFRGNNSIKKLKKIYVKFNFFLFLCVLFNIYFLKER